jgi:hypothetical protein
MIVRCGLFKLTWHLSATVGCGADSQVSSAIAARTQEFLLKGGKLYCEKETKKQHSAVAKKDGDSFRRFESTL